MTQRIEKQLLRNALGLPLLGDLWVVGFFLYMMYSLPPYNQLTSVSHLVSMFASVGIVSALVVWRIFRTENESQHSISFMGSLFHCMTIYFAFRAIGDLIEKDSLLQFRYLGFGILGEIFWWGLSSIMVWSERRFAIDEVPKEDVCFDDIE